MRKLIAILFIILVVSCKQKISKEQNSAIEFDEQYFFGFEEDVFIDSNLVIPDSVEIYNDRTEQLISFQYFLNDSNVCFKNQNDVCIKAQYIVKSVYGACYIIKINEYNHFDYKFRHAPDIPDCGFCSPDKTLIGKRLILNKERYNIGDTINGKLLLKYYVDHYCTRDSSERFKIEVDSCLFKYKLYDGNKNTIVNFEKDFNRVK